MLVFLNFAFALFSILVDGSWLSSIPTFSLSELFYSIIYNRMSDTNSFHHQLVPISSLINIHIRPNSSFRFPHFSIAIDTYPTPHNVDDEYFAIHEFSLLTAAHATSVQCEFILKIGHSIFSITITSTPSSQNEPPQHHITTPHNMLNDYAHFCLLLTCSSIHSYFFIFQHQAITITFININASNLLTSTA